MPQSNEQTTDLTEQSIEPEIPQMLLEYYWGKDWPGLKDFYSDGTPVAEEDKGFPKWERYSDEQKEEMLELLQLITRYGLEQREDENEMWRETSKAFQRGILPTDFKARKMELTTELQALTNQEGGTDGN